MTRPQLRRVILILRSLDASRLPDMTEAGADKLRASPCHYYLRADEDTQEAIYQIVARKMAWKIMEAV